MQYDHKQEAKQFRRVMLDVMEICPQRFQEDILLSMAMLDETRDFFFPGEIADLLDFFHRLQGGRLVSRYSAHQKALLSNIILWLEAAHLHHYRKSYCHLTGEPRYKEFLRLKQAQKQDLERMMSSIRKSGAREIIITDLPYVSSLSIGLIIFVSLTLAIAFYHFYH
ncbi:hypothetical protein [Rahnella sikkimica]|uniref:Uncharacterized protein n=1 Tax=Rahnella sikkimica TaxID=1805933 RepID=A0A2L1UZ35_9GAMM|nr:hypothetical protein [Rahnella sikkimica]AVF38206.1 hypothetical protein BV494_25345 [Rahnella sikkimica]